MITYKKGNLLSAKEKVIAHQVNCFGGAAGLAAAIFRKWPTAERDYQQLIKKVPAKSLLGMSHLTGRQKDGHIICNLFGQYNPGADYRPERLKTALEQLGNSARLMNWSVALPYGLSCGICGGDWDEVIQIIEQAMDGVNCVIYRLAGDAE